MIDKLWIYNYNNLIDENHYVMDLQMFADDSKTEPATQKRKQDARKKVRYFIARRLHQQ
jgi:hypothetical protein